jgi:hypothetical protein
MKKSGIEEGKCTKETEFVSEMRIDTVVRRHVLNREGRSADSMDKV